MREIRALICDDEPLARRGVQQLLARHPDVVVVGEARDGREALSAIDALAPDLIFLDVQMPELDGFDVVRARGAHRMPAVIFVTAYDEFAVRAFEVNALDYLVKPLAAPRFDAAMGRLRRQLRDADALSLSRRLAALLDGDPRPPMNARKAAGGRIAVTTAHGLVLLDVTDIDWISAENYYAAIHVAGRRYLVREALGSLEQRLDPETFMRTHRAALVNVERIRELRSSSDAQSVIILRDGTSVPLSRRRRDAVAERLRRG